MLAFFCFFTISELKVTSDLDKADTYRNLWRTAVRPYENIVFNEYGKPLSAADAWGSNLWFD
jgi:hypothetical protein